MEARKPLDVMMPSRGMGVVDDLIAERLPLHRLWLEADPDAWLAASGEAISSISFRRVGFCRENPTVHHAAPSLYTVTGAG